MADISGELLTISDAVYGSQVRNAIIDALTKMNAHIERISIAKSAGVYMFRGTTPTTAELPVTKNAIGDCYYVTSMGETYAWTGNSWNSIGGIVEIPSSDVSSGSSDDGGGISLEIEESTVADSEASGGYIPAGSD